MTIDDNSPNAQKIMQGYSWILKDGKLTIGAKTEYDLKAFEDKVNSGTQTNADILNFIKQLIKIYKQTKWQA
jgi:hypothetical protein